MTTDNVAPMTSPNHTLRGRIAALARPFVLRAARAYVAGDNLADALHAARTLQSDAFATTLGYWDGPPDTPHKITEQNLALIDACSEIPHSYVSIKLPSLGGDGPHLDQVAAAALWVGMRLHFDALAPETADETRLVVNRLAEQLPALSLSYTLPGRWLRSIDDADWLNRLQLPVRVVKGQWEDPAAPHRDPRLGFLEVVDRLAGQAKHVAVASHDVPMARAACERLQAAGTSCELELLYGLPRRAALQMAAELRVPVRVYVPFGQAFLPYALSRAVRNPRTLWWLTRDLLSLGAR